MPTTPATDNLLDHLNLDLAIKRALCNSLRDNIPNRLDAALLRRYSPQITERVIGLLDDQNMDWANGVATYYDLPRADKLTRPVCYISVDVRVVYQALVDAVANVFEPYVASISSKKGGEVRR